METIYVQFTTSDEAQISSVFPCPQDPDLYPNQGEIDPSDARYRAFYNSLPTMCQPYMPAPSK